MPVRTDDKIRCSFCGKTQDQVKKLIAGSNNVYICDECIDLCAEILEEEFDSHEEEGPDFSDINLMKPKEIKSFLDDYVIGQDGAKKVLSVAVYNFVIKEKRCLMKHAFSFQKQNNSFFYEAPDYSLRKQSNKIGFLLCGSIAAMYLFSYALQWFLIGIGYQKSTYNEAISILNYLLNGSVSILSMLLPAVIFIAIFKLKLTNIIVIERVKPAVGISFFFIGATICLLANFPSNWISAMLENFGFQGSSQSIPVVPTIPSYIMNTLATAVVPPFVEEFLFRGVILSQFRKYGDVFAIIASALLFGLLHRNFSQIVFAFICGLALGITLVRTNNIWIPVSIHMFVNGFYVLLNIVRFHCSAAVYTAVFYIIILVMIFMSLFSVLYLLLKKKQLSSFQPGMLSVGSSMGNLFANPGILIFLGICIIQSISRLGVF